MLKSCAIVGNVELLQLLIDRKASINKKTRSQKKQGHTALFIAANKTQFGAVKLLMEKSTLEDLQNSEPNLYAEVQQRFQLQPDKLRELKKIWEGKKMVLFFANY